MQHCLETQPPRPRPGDRLVMLLWLRALSNGGRLPMPTIDRINILKALSTTWQVGLDE